MSSSTIMPTFYTESNFRLWPVFIIDNSGISVYLYHINSSFWANVWTWLHFRRTRKFEWWWRPHTVAISAKALTSNLMRCIYPSVGFLLHTLGTGKVYLGRFSNEKYICDHILFYIPLTKNRCCVRNNCVHIGSSIWYNNLLHQYQILQLFF